MDLSQWTNEAWAAHADDPEGVARRVDDEALPALAGLPPAQQPAQALAVAHLGQHVLGTHLARWDAGRALLARIAALPGAAADEATRDAIGRFDASLALCAAGVREAPPDGDPSDRVRIAALAAAHLAEHDTPRAAALMRAALDLAAALPNDGPHARALAVAGNNLAATLEEKPTRSADERALMILAAQTGRRYWAIAGTWLETERADYRLSRTWLAAGEPSQALVHARACLDRVAAHGDVPLERFFGWEAMALAAAAAGDTAASTAARAQAQAAFDALSPDDQGWCRASLEALRS